MKRQSAIEVEIHGSHEHGYHLVVAPDGFFTADHWYPTLEAARSEAHEWFGISLDAWISCSESA